MRHIIHAAILAQSLLENEEDGWIGVDLDGTLAKYTKYKGATHIGDPIPAMAARVRRWVGRGKKVKIFTARADDEKSVNAIKKWLKKHDLPDLEVTNLKDKNMIELWDDRAVQVKKNTGERVAEAEDPKAFIKQQPPPPPNRFFMTSDGYMLRYDWKMNVWTDGDLSFANRNGHPIDIWGEKVRGSLTETEDPKSVLRQAQGPPYVAWVDLWIDRAHYGDVDIENEGPWRLPVKHVQGQPKWTVNPVHDQRLVCHDVIIPKHEIPEELRHPKYAGIIRDLEFYLSHGEYDFKGNLVKPKAMRRRGNPEYHWKIVKGKLPPARLSEPENI